MDNIYLFLVNLDWQAPMPTGLLWICSTALSSPRRFLYVFCLTVNTLVTLFTFSIT